MLGRTLILTGFVVLFRVLIAWIPIEFGTSALPLHIIPAIIVLLVFYCTAMESITTIFIVGILVDAWTGLPIGLSILAQLCVWLSCSVARSWFGKPQLFLIYGFIFLSSLMYRLSICMMVQIFGISSCAGQLDILLLAPIFDGFVGLLCLKALLWLLVKLKLVTLAENTIDPVKVEL